MTDPQNPDVPDRDESPERLTGSAPQSGQDAEPSLSKPNPAEETTILRPQGVSPAEETTILPAGTEWAAPASAYEPDSTAYESREQPTYTSGSGYPQASQPEGYPPYPAQPWQQGQTGQQYQQDQPRQGQPYPGQPQTGGHPYPGQQYTGSPSYPGQQYGGDQPYPGQPYGGDQPYQGQPYGGGQSYQGQPYSGGQSYQGQQHYPGQQGQPYGGYPPAGQYPQGAYGAAPRQSSMQLFSILGFICAPLAVFLCPILFGPAGIALGLVGRSKGESLGKWAAIAAGIALVLGLFFSYFVWLGYYDDSGTTY
ncbi:hypothetical protein ACFVMC_08300 [Nocardia sp. NPDC127579]|uniref:hypothetical protein n=1 Tax=Nocardia sp. NPDC127579 TaxID=3345402 RepID=UPI00362BA2F1